VRRRWAPAEGRGLTPVVLAKVLQRRKRLLTRRSDGVPLAEETSIALRPVPEGNETQGILRRHVAIFMGVIHVVAHVIAMVVHVLVLLVLLVMVRTMIKSAVMISHFVATESKRFHRLFVAVARDWWGRSR
jgi:hypothetical protein